MQVSGTSGNVGIGNGVAGLVAVAGHRHNDH